MPMMRGGTPAAADATMRASGFRPSSEGRDAAREALSAPVGSAESVDFVREDNTNEVLDAVDDNIQEPVQTYSDEDEADVAEQK